MNQAVRLTKPQERWIGARGRIGVIIPSTSGLSKLQSPLSGRFPNRGQRRLLTYRPMHLSMKSLRSNRPTLCAAACFAQFRRASAAQMPT
jgi:hypothetical protein